MLEQAWAKSPDSVLRALSTNLHEGLSEQEAQNRLRRHGLNQLREKGRLSSWRILRDQFASLIVALLVAAAGLAFAFGDHVEGSAIVAVIMINASIGFWTERRAHRAMEALRSLGQREARVRRDGSVRTLASTLLVPGDILVLDAGDVLTADARVISASRLQADESTLTGESLPSDKDIALVAVETALVERSSMLFKGSALTRGTAEAVVVATGMATELGQISALVESAEPETTPLEQRLNQLGKRLVGLTLAVATLVAGFVVLSGREWVFAVEIGIALAVATIPEGLPIVATVALARGMWRMARRNALVEQLNAVETLGSTTILLTDKTGTLTENRMTAVELRMARGVLAVDEIGVEAAAKEEGLQERSDLIETLRVAVLCNNATLDPFAVEGDRAIGDPTEVALLLLGEDAGHSSAELGQEWPKVGEIAFDSDTKRMATLHSSVDGSFAAVKGAPEAIIERCSQIRTPLGVEALSPDDHATWLESGAEMAATGKRVLALASKQGATPDAFEFSDLTLLGLVGLADPPRETVPAAIRACQAAGMRVVMVTGDHGATAWNIAAAVGLVDPSAPPDFIDGRELEPIPSLPDDAKRLLLNANVIARATPRQKLDLIALHQSNGAIVAMTGDGVNDAPALKKADIGIAMGLRGTQVAREAADIVLRDDELGSIVAAVAEGRAVFANIRKFVVYLMSCNVSEIFAVGLGVLSQGPLPILPLQILFLNLVTDVFPALALGVGEGSPALMEDPPRDPKEPIVGKRHWRTIFALGGVMALSVLGALWLAVVVLGFEGAQATTVAFLTLAMAQLWHVFSMRNQASGWIRNEVTQNPWVWGAISLCLSLLAAAVYWPPLARILSIVDPELSGWSVAFGMSFIPLLFGQLSLAFSTHNRRHDRKVIARSAIPMMNPKR